MKEGYVFLKESNVARLIAITLCFAICAFLVFFGVPHYNTNDDVTLNNIAVGNYGQHNSPYLVFSNICYGYLISALYAFTTSINWYAVFPIVVAIYAFCLIAYVFAEKQCSLVGITLPTLFLFFFGVDTIVEFQFTHLAGFFSAVGLFLLYSVLFNKSKHHSVILYSAVFLSWLGFCFRLEAFLSVAAIAGVCCLIKIIKNTFWKLPIKQIFFEARGFILLLFLVVACTVVNHIAYQGNPDWKFWTEYNTIRASLLDYPLLDYETYESEYMKLGIDSLDFQMLCSWNYADLNKFSIETMDRLYNFQKMVKTTSFDVTDTLRVFLGNLRTAFDNNAYMQMVLMLGVSCVFWKKRGIWLLAPLGVFAIELLYLSYEGRFIYRSYIGMWMFVSLIVFWAVLENIMSRKKYNVSTRELVRKTIALLLGTSIIFVPWADDIRDNGRKTSERINESMKCYSWRSVLSQDTESLFVHETLFSAFPSSFISLKPVQRLSNNLYCLGGWTIPSPLQQYLLDKYEIEDMGIVNALLDDEKSVYYIEEVNQTWRNRFLAYIQKEYDQNAKFEIVDTIDNINVYRFYLDKTGGARDPKLIESVYGLDTSILSSDISYEIAISDEIDHYVIAGWAYHPNIDAYNQSVWLRVTFANDERVQYYRSSKYVNKQIADYVGNRHAAASGIQWILRKEEFSFSDTQKFEMIVESSEGRYYVDITEDIEKFIQEF